MRIGLDGRELGGRPTGIGRYVAALCAEWAALPAAAAHEVVVYMPPPARAPAAPPGAGARVTATMVPGRPGVWWEQVALPRAAGADRLDVFFGPGYSVPLRLGVPRVVVLHDISFVTHPEWFGWREGIRRRWLARRAAAAADTVIAVSEFGRRELVRHLDLDPGRVRVIHNGVTPMGAGTEPARDRPVVLHVGAVFNRRHLPTLIAAFAHLARTVPGARLVIVGPNRTRPFQDLAGLARAAGVGDAVTCHDYVDDDALRELYRQASAFAFLSEYEGFGLTPLEALGAGVPVVVGDTPVAREVYRAAARYVPVTDPAAVARALVDVITDETTRRAMRAAAAAVVAGCSWVRAATATLAVLETVAARSR